MTHSVIYVGENTHIVEVQDLKDNLDVVETAATVELLSVLDALGAPVAGITVPIALPHVANGLYRATIPYGGAFVAGQTYKARVRAIGSQSFRADWIEILLARVRSA